MATLFTKVMQSGIPPPNWTRSKVSLLYKSGDPADPANFRMIALSNAVGKIYHQILAERFEQFMLDNELIDNTLQKAFLKGISGCTEHNVVIHELLSHAKSKSRSIHVTWFDLADAFGSVNHNLIHFTLQRHDFPPLIQCYIKNLYSTLSGQVRTKEWVSNEFQFQRGIFQGDPLSPLVFILCFDPIIQFLKVNSTFGYDLDGTRIITAPFADDFCLVTGNKRSHQRLLNEIDHHIKSMGLRLKPSKCRSLSFSSGKFNDVIFSVGDDQISSVGNEVHKYLGAVITKNLTSSDIHEYLSSKIEKSLKNIDSSLIRNEYKLKVYSRYLLSSLRFDLTVNDMTYTHCKSLDMLSNRFLKKWCGLPRPGTLAFVHMPNGLAIPSISDLYTQCHTLSYISMREKGDDLVNHCLDSQLDRESKWVRKRSIIVKSDEVYSSVKGVHPTLKGKKKEAKKILTHEVSTIWHTHVKDLVVQGRFLDLLSMESNCMIWKSIMYNLPVKVLKFLVNAVSDTVNTRANLLRWGKSTTSKCRHCDCVETLNHVLNCCSVFLSQGRYTWRHNNVLKCFVEMITESISPDTKILHDIPYLTGYSPVSTIPLPCTQTNLKPDLCIYDENSKKIMIMELTVPFELGIEKAHQYKVNKYSSLVTDIRNNNYEVEYLAIEVGSRGFISSNNTQRLKQMLGYFHERNTKPREFQDKLSKMALVSSFAIYCAKGEPSWQDCNNL